MVLIMIFSKLVVCGEVIQDSNGTWKEGFASSFYPTSILHGKLLAFLKGLELAYIKSLFPLVVEIYFQVPIMDYSTWT